LHFERSDILEQLPCLPRFQHVSPISQSREVTPSAIAGVSRVRRTLVNLFCKRTQVDEIWAFCYAKEKNVPMAKAAPEQAGDLWTWTAIDADTKLVPSWLIGGQASEYAMAFMGDLAKRLASRVQLTSDGHKAYLEAVEGAFGADIDYAMLVKVFGPAPEDQRRYSSAECVGPVKHRVEGNPDSKHVSTILCRATKSQHADGDASLYEVGECLLEKSRVPRSCRRDLLHALQFCAHSSDATGDARDGGWRHQYIISK
jgi:hypothetical protein